MIEFVISARGLPRDYAIGVVFELIAADARINKNTKIVGVESHTPGFEFLDVRYSDAIAKIRLQRISGSGVVSPEISLRLSSDYAVSNIEMWKNKDYLYSENNYHIDNIGVFLGLPNFSTRFQYVEFKPKITIRLEMDQSNIQFGADQNWNYCRITRYSNVVDSAYFFIKKIS